MDGKVRAEYSIENFADDLTNVYAGNEKSLVIETPQGRFEFVKTASARSLELAKAVNRTLQREAAVHSAIEILENPEKTHDERVLVLSDLSRHFDDSYVVQGSLRSISLSQHARSLHPHSLPKSSRKSRKRSPTSCAR